MYDGLLEAYGQVVILLTIFFRPTIPPPSQGVKPSPKLALITTLYHHCPKLLVVGLVVYNRVATDTGNTGKYLNILEKYFILELYLKTLLFRKKVKN